MTKAALVQRASQLNIPNTGNRVEAAFENFAFESISSTAPAIQRNNNRRFKYDSKLRENATKDKPRSRGRDTRVEPDAVNTLTVVPVAFINGIPVPKPEEAVHYPESSFYDAKATKSRIRLKDGNYQILGFLDALDNSLAGKAWRLPQSIPPEEVPVPRMQFLTVADTYIAEDVKKFANEHKIALFQYVVCDNLPNGGQLGTDDLIMGKGILINPSVYKKPDRPIPIDIPRLPGRAGSLGSLSNNPPPDPDNPPPDESSNYSCYDYRSWACPEGCCT